MSDYDTYAYGPDAETLAEIREASRPKVRIARSGHSYFVTLSAGFLERGRWVRGSRKSAERLARRKLAKYLRLHADDGVTVLRAEDL